MRAWRIVAVVVAGALAMGAIPTAAVGTAGREARRAPFRERSVRLRPGLWLTVVKYPRQPNEARLLTVTPSLGPTLDVQAGRDRYPIWVRPSVVAAQMNDVAIVNAAFVIGGVPKHASLIDGELWTSGTETAEAIAFTADGDRVYVGRPHLSMQASVEGGTTFAVQSWNARTPRAQEVSAYSSRGSNVVAPPGTTDAAPTDPVWCEARLVPAGPIGWTGAGRAGQMRAYEVEARPDPCPRTRVKVGPTPGAVVLAGRGGTVGGHLVRALTVGSTVRLSWSFAHWPGVTDVIGGLPLLVSGGRNVAAAPRPGQSYFYYENPRTAVGVNAGCLDDRTDSECKVMLATVDGRQAGWSVGWTLRQIAALLVRHGAARAINFDGGGSTEMWVRHLGRYCHARPATGGCFVDRPSDANGERSTSVSVGVLPGADPGESYLHSPG
jgi:hypothetical protein